tara:strand:+ start:495 stop:1463 length:969 start_codon:yes stop_codon:yes gene_type:complete
MSILKANRIENLTTTDGGINVNNSGNVGVGTSSPVTQLHIQKATGGLAGVQISSSTYGSTLTDGLFVGIDDSNSYLYNYENTPLTFGTNSTERLRIDSSGNVGIGTSSPVSIFDVTVGASGQRRFVVNYDDSIITIKGSNAASNPETFRVIGDNIRFNTGTSGSGTERMRLTNNGLTFNGDTAASNALDDYEEGTFTPTLTGASGSPTHNAQTGHYTKIGRLVHCRIHMSISAKSTLSGALKISSLPFSVSNVDANTSLDFSGVLSYFNNLASTAYFISASPVGNTTTASLYFRGSTNLTDVLEAGDVNNNFDFRAQLTYYV